MADKLVAPHGSLCHRGEGPEIEITPEMVAAGVCAFYQDYQPAFESASEGVEKIFRAMIGVWLKSSDAASHRAQ